MARAPDGALYNVSDGQPGNMTDYFNRVADLAGLPRTLTANRVQIKHIRGSSAHGAGCTDVTDFER